MGRYRREAEERVVRVAGIRSVGGKVETLLVGDPRPLAPDEVLLEVRTAGVGHWDEIARTGDWDLGVSPPMALGVEAAGVISAVGADVNGLRVGDEALCHPVPLRDQGCWAPLLIAPAGSVATKPSDTSWDIAAVFPVPALTAEQVIGEALDIQSGETLLVHGAGGSTGGMIVQLAALRGADVIATCSPRSAERVRSYGARAVIDYHQGGWPDTVRALTNGRGVHAVANAAVGGAATAITTVVDKGRLATITSDPPPNNRGITITNLYVRSDGPQLSRLAALLGEHKLKIPAPRRCRIRQAADALAQVVGGRAAGGLVIAP
jgi:NADPH:quinone reductase-like Zn-dependent oxidoreductase